MIIGNFKEMYELTNTIKDDKVKKIVTKILDSFSSKNVLNQEIIDHTKKVVNAVKIIAETRGYLSLAIDVLTAAAILHDLYKEIDGELHPLMIRYKHKKDLEGKEFEPGLIEQICLIIEGHEGANSIIPKIASREGTIEQVLTDANAIINNLEMIVGE